MTSPALVVLTLALVCSTFGTAMEQTADRASEHAMHIKPITDPNASEMGIRTKINNYIVNNQLDNLNYKESFNVNDDIYTRKKFEMKNVNDDETELAVKAKELNIFKEFPKVKRLKYSKFYKETAVDIQENKYLKHKNVNTNESKKKNNNLLFNIEQKDAIATESRLRHFDEGKTFNSRTVKKVPFDVKSSSTHLKRVKRQETLMEKDKRCEEFKYNTMKKSITHPYNSNISKNYYGNIECEYVIEAKETQVINLIFVDVFHIEEHPKCAYDYLEIRDGKYGFSKLRGRFCGETFPQTITSSGPYMWLKFKADETIEYEGFKITVEIISSPTSYSIPKECYKELKGEPSGLVSKEVVDPVCIEKSKKGNHGIDLLWNITTAENTDINLDFTVFKLAKPNECEENIVEVFGYIMEEDKNLARYCGSAANALSSRVEGKASTGRGNVMYIHMYISQQAYEETKVNATYTAFRTLDPMKDEKCLDKPDEFNCDDNTCIAYKLTCNGHPNCRLKADEDPDFCKGVQSSAIQETHILVILVIFSLILSGMSIVFLFKCFKKLYQDHKAIKDHIRQSTEDRLDTLLSDSCIILNPDTLPGPRASLERENHTNELFKQQRSSQHKGLPQQLSIESDFQETQLDLDDEPWHRDVDRLPEPQNVRAERSGRTRRSDTSKKEESMRSRKESIEEKKEIRDAAVGAPDTKESGCQTRESLFQTDIAPSSDGSNSASNSRGFSTFGYSGATLVRPSPPPAPPAPMITSTQIELLRQLPSLEITHKSQKKLSDRRPMSAETTRSAPDVIIVSKPIR